jgi:hypothetical protein
MKIGEEIFSTLKGYGYLVELYDKTGKGPMSSPELAEYVYAKDKMSDDSVMIRLPKENESNEYKKVVIYKSHGMDEKFSKLLMTIKKITLKYGNTVTFRQFGRNIEPKDLAYLPAGEQELENAAVNEAIIKPKKKFSDLSLSQKKALFRKIVSKYNSIASKEHSRYMDRGVKPGSKHDWYRDSGNFESKEMDKLDKLFLKYFGDLLLKKEHKDFSIGSYDSRDPQLMAIEWLDGSIFDPRYSAKGDIIEDVVPDTTAPRIAITSTPSYTVFRNNYGLELKNEHSEKSVYFQGDDSVYLNGE